MHTADRVFEVHALPDILNSMITCMITKSSKVVSTTRNQQARSPSIKTRYYEPPCINYHRRKYGRQHLGQLVINPTCTLACFQDTAYRLTHCCGVCLCIRLSSHAKLTSLISSADSAPGRSCLLAKTSRVAPASLCTQRIREQQRRRHIQTPWLSEHFTLVHTWMHMLTSNLD